MNLRWIPMAFLGLGIVWLPAMGQEKAADKPKEASKEAPKDAPKEAPKDAPKPAAPAVTGAKAKLAWTFTKDKSFFQTMTTTTKQELVVQGSKVNQEQK